VEYLLEEDMFLCPPGSYELSFLHLSGLFLIAVRLNQPDPVDSQSLLDLLDRRFWVRYLLNIPPARKGKAYQMRVSYIRSITGLSFLL